ncbi:hypothetical protein EGW08_022664, partial [Elysia chlorotica]
PAARGFPHGYRGTEPHEVQNQPAFRRTTSKLSVVADVHKSVGSAESVSALQAVPASVTSAVYINSVAISNSVPKDPFQFRKFSVLKHIPQNTGIQETPELENGNNNVSSSIHNNTSNSYQSNNKHISDKPGDSAWSASRRQRSPSPPFPSPPPLSPDSESVNSEDPSISASTSCSNLHPQEAELPPPPAELTKAHASSVYEDLPPPPLQHHADSEWHAQSSHLEFPDPPSPARLAIAARQPLSSSQKQKDFTGTAQVERVPASSTSTFKQYFDSGTKANFARAKALFGAVDETRTEPTKAYIGRSEVQSKVSRKSAVGPSRHQPQGCVNPDSGESETDCSNKSHKVSSTQPPLPKLVMEPVVTQAESNGSVSPAPSTDSVQSLVNTQGSHVTIISTSAGKSGDGLANGSGTAVHEDKPNGAPAGSNTNNDIVGGGSSSSRAPVPVAASSSSSNGVVLRGRSDGPARAVARMVVSAGPESLTRHVAQNGQSSSSSSSQPPSPAVSKSKHDLIADIQSAVSGTSNLSLRRAKSRGEGVSMVYSSKRNSTGQDQSKMTDTTRPLTGDFDPKNFLDQIEKVDSTGRAIPEWRRHVLAKHAAEKAQKEFEEKRVENDYESRFKDMPAWKRALIERREAQARKEEAASKK